jgi:ubiquinone/menaquinone biosynthesis C-methylase UbiE
MSIQNAYTDWSKTYDSDDNATRDLDKTVLEKLLSGKRFKSIIEIGCGTGKNTELLSRLGEKVQAMDFSEGMISKAKEKFGGVSKITFVAADITKPWPCASRCADLVTCNLVLEHIQNLTPVFAEAARALAKGGCLLISELHPFRQYAGGVANFQRGDQTTHISAFTHYISDFVRAAEASGFKLQTLHESWHEKDTGKPPRLVSFIFSL